MAQTLERGLHAAVDPGIPDRDDRAALELGLDFMFEAEIFHFFLEHPFYLVIRMSAGRLQYDMSLACLGLLQTFEGAQYPGQ